MQSHKRISVQNAFFAFGLLVCIGYGLVTIHHSQSLRVGELAGWNQIMAFIVSEDFATGPRSFHVLQEGEGRPYRVAVRQMSWHMAVGGLGLIFGILQFFPSLRRKMPKAHKACGYIFSLCAVVSLSSALWYLAITPFDLVYSGPIFAFGLLLQAILTLSFLALAFRAIYRRDFRSHMVWMALAFAIYLSAPMLRLGFITIGNIYPVTLEQTNLGFAGTLNLYCILTMSLWLYWVGNHNIRPTQRPGLPNIVWIALSVSAALVLIHESMLAPAGLDILGSYRPLSQLAGSQILFWAIPATVAALLAPRSLRDGSRLKISQGIFVAASIMGAFILSVSEPKGSQLIETVQPIFWGSLAVLLSIHLLMAIISSPDASGREPWSIQLQCLMLSPALWPIMSLNLYVFGYNPVETIAGGLGFAFSTMGLIGFVMAWRPAISYRTAKSVGTSSPDPA